MTNVKVYVSLQKVGAGERDGERRRRRRRRTGGGGSEGGNAMHSIKWPEKTTERGEGRRGNDRNEREIQETEEER